MPHLRLNNTEFYYELSGKGHPLVLVAGYAVDHFFWSPLLTELKKHFQILTFDHRGVGQTRDQNNTPLTAKIMAEDLLGLIKALDLTKPHVVGQSMGGTIVQHLAAHHPEEISKLAILNSTLKWRTAMLVGFRSMLKIMRDDCPFDTLFDLNLSWIYGEAFLQNKAKVECLRTLFLNNPQPPTLVDLERQYHALIEFDGHAHLSKIKAPTLVVSGLEDIISLPYESREIAEGIPGAELIELFCGHGIIA